MSSFTAASSSSLSSTGTENLALDIHACLQSGRFDDAVKLFVKADVQEAAQVFSPLNSPVFFSQYLVCLLINNELTCAKYLVERKAAAFHGQHLFQDVCSICQRLLSQDISAALAATRKEWPAELHTLVTEHLYAALVRRELETVALLYTKIALDKLAVSINMESTECAAVLRGLNWQVEEAMNTVYPAAIATTAASTAPSLVGSGSSSSSSTGSALVSVNAGIRALENMVNIISELEKPMLEPADPSKQPTIKSEKKEKKGTTAVRGEGVAAAGAMDDGAMVF